MSGGVFDANKTYNDDQSAVADVLNSGNSVEAAITVGTSSVEAKVGASRLTGRKALSVFNNSNSTIYWGYTSGVTTSSGTPIFKDQQIVFAVGDGQSVYLISGSAGNNVRITEGA